ncbi:MAG: AMP-binding protein [Clostridiaceae bacterium]|nr:AMP-binding protein [Clostridiaceae bacterium]
MRIITGQRYFEAWPFSNLMDMLRQCADRHTDLIAYRFRRKPNDVEMTKTYPQLLSDINALGTALKSLGVASDSKIAVYGDNSYEWAVAYNSAINGCGVVVPLDKLLPAREIEILLERSSAEVLFYGLKQADVVHKIAKHNKELKYLICLDNETFKSMDCGTDSRFFSMYDLLHKGAELLKKGDHSFLDTEIDSEAMAAIFFTSGTTASAKGVMLSHKNICANIRSISGILPLYPGERALSLLPLHHTFENTVGMLYMLYSGVCICFTDGLRHIMKNIQEWQIECMIAVPVLFENMYSRLQKNLKSSGKAGLISVLRPIARRLSYLGLDVRRRIFSEILSAFGGKLRLVVVGAANIDAEIVQTFNDFGIEFYMGYGMTESSPVIAACHRQHNTIGSVGPPLPEIQLAIDVPDDQPDSIGEILTRSDCVMLGYYHDSEATSEVITSDGWLRTGDIGQIDEKGALRITGRAKSMIVLNNGKKVFPEEIEQLLNQIPSISESMVWGQPGSKDGVDICALIRIERDQLPELAGADDVIWSKHIKKAVQAINQGMPVYKGVRYVLLTDNELIKTTTLKVKRPKQFQKIQNILQNKDLTIQQAQNMFIESL